MPWSIEDVDALAREMRACALELERARDEARAEDESCRSLSVVRGTTLAGNVAVRVRAWSDAVREHAGDAFVDVARAREETMRAVVGGGGGDGENVGGDATGADETFEDMFDEEGKPRRGYVPKRGHTLPGMGGMSDAIGELRGVLKKVGVKTKTPEGDEDVPATADGDDFPSSGAEADGEASEVESGGERRAGREDAVPAPMVEKPQWMIELAAKNAAKRAAQANSDITAASASEI